MRQRGQPTVECVDDPGAILCTRLEISDTVLCRDCTPLLCMDLRMHGTSETTGNAGLGLVVIMGEISRSRTHHSHLFQVRLIAYNDFGHASIGVLLDIFHPVADIFE